MFQVSVRVEDLRVIVLHGVSVDNWRSHTNRRASGYKELLAVEICENELLVRSHTILAMRSTRIKTKRLFDERIEERQPVERFGVCGLIWRSHHRL